MADRTVHGRTPEGHLIVRYDRAGKWFAESEAGTGRRSLNLAAAADLATRAGGEAYLGRAGGKRFDALVRSRQAHG